MSKFTDITMGFRHRIKEIIYGIKYLSLSDDSPSIDKDEKYAVISMVDGKMWHGGLTDRFKGIVSGALFAQYTGRPFRIKYDFPFQLTDYLIPNQYDWTISESNISKSLFNSRPLCLRHEKGRRMLRVKSKGQIRYYNNVDLTQFLEYPPFNQDWGMVFNWLFRPSPLLQKNIEIQLARIGGEYIAMVFRFQNLLGDFQEYKFKEISDEKRKKRLIEANLAEIQDMLSSQLTMRSSKKIVVTSDSDEFLESAQKIEGVIALRGKSSHVDLHDTENENHMKAFIDFFILSKAKAIYSVTIDNMYPSDFPKYAAKVGNVPFHRIIKKLN